MARDSFIFYRSFLESIKCMPSEVQAEIYPAIVEYAHPYQASDGFQQRTL